MRKIPFFFAVCVLSATALSAANLSAPALSASPVARAAAPAGSGSTVRSSGLSADSSGLGDAHTPPATWQEHWFEHRQLLNRVYNDASDVVYYDNGVRPSVTWPFATMGKVWDYTKKTYGAFGPDPRLYVIMHAGRYSGGHPSTYMDSSHDNRNVIDCGSGDPAAWTRGAGDIDIPAHEVGHIVEGASKGVHGSPAFGIWHDSKWMEIYQYDLYLGLGLHEDAQRWYNSKITQSDDFPRAGAHWFRDWFYPIYANYGKEKALNNFFTLLSNYFPQRSYNSGVAVYPEYARDMNFGEFVHFWSGAAGADLKPLALAAFGLKDEQGNDWTGQLQQAKKDFPGVAYPAAGVSAPGNLRDLQQKFVDLRFGMFIHFNIPTFMDQDWADPDASPSIFDPKKLDCTQWAKAAKSANMSYGCLTTKHHSGFCIWDTKTTDYNVMHSPLRRDIVREYVDAFRAQGLKTMLYYSILDTHHKLRPGHITKQHIGMIKAQLTELLTNYGEITALIIDGWDAPWSRISYDDVPFEEIYTLIKSLQPNCLVIDLNSAKYPSEALLYTDIKSYEQGAGQHISTATNRLPAMSCLPLNSAWFWKTDFPSTPVKDPKKLVNEDIVPYNKIYDNFILNVAPNRDGLIDNNALTALAEIGKTWKNESPVAALPDFDAPVISPNIAKRQPANASWSDDMWIMDFGNDDDFSTAWLSNPTVKSPWYEIAFDKDKSFNTIVITEDKPNISQYRLEYFNGGAWKPLVTGTLKRRMKIHRFDRVWGGKVRILIDKFDSPPGISEFGVYDERR